MNERARRRAIPGSGDKVPDGRGISHLRRWTGRERVDEDVLTAAPARKMSAVLDRPPGQALGPSARLPPGWHWLYFHSASRRSELGPDGHEVRGGFLPPVPLPRRMWAGGRLRFLGGLELGEVVRRTSTVASVEHKEGRSGPLVFVGVRHRISSEGGRLAIDEVQDLVYRDGSDPVESLAGRSAPAHPPSEPPEWSESFSADAVTLFRFSALTFNSHRIHYDVRYATEVEGYRDLVVHGPLTALLLLDAGSRWIGAPPRSFSYRATGPLFCGEEFTIAGRATRGSDEAVLWAAHPERGLAMRATFRPVR